jgi:hypothetical protein
MRMSNTTRIMTTTGMITGLLPGAWFREEIS